MSNDAQRYFQLDFRFARSRLRFADRAAAGPGLIGSRAPAAQRNLSRVAQSDPLSFGVFGDGETLSKITTERGIDSEFGDFSQVDTKASIPTL